MGGGSGSGARGGSGGGRRLDKRPHPRNRRQQCHPRWGGLLPVARPGQWRPRQGPARRARAAPHPPEGTGEAGGARPAPPTSPQPQRQPPQAAWGGGATGSSGGGGASRGTALCHRGARVPHPASGGGEAPNSHPPAQPPPHPQRHQPDRPRLFIGGQGCLAHPPPPHHTISSAGPHATRITAAAAVRRTPQGGAPTAGGHSRQAFRRGQRMQGVRRPSPPPPQALGCWRGAPHRDWGGGPPPHDSSPPDSSPPPPPSRGL